jgi:hypothetical protein
VIQLKLSIFYFFILLAVRSNCSLSSCNRIKTPAWREKKISLSILKQSESINCLSKTHMNKLWICFHYFIILSNFDKCMDKRWQNHAMDRTWQNHAYSSQLEERLRRGHTGRELTALAFIYSNARKCQIIWPKEWNIFQSVWKSIQLTSIIGDWIFKYCSCQSKKKVAILGY